MEQSQKSDINFERDKVPTEVRVELLAPNGLGFGKGNITSTREGLTDTVKLKAHQVICDPDQILVDVSYDDDGQVLDDDGCGDGRGINKVFSKLNDSFKKSLDRAKVFGGAVTMTAAADIGTDNSQPNLLGTFKGAISKLSSKMINFGAHTDNHAHGANCGCGAIDKAPEIIESALIYSKNISAVMTDVLGLNNEVTASAITNYGNFYSTMDKTDYSGAAVKNEIVDSGAVVKELKDDHKEWAIVLNFVEGKTVNQRAVREATDREAQVFAVDVWRLKSIADRAYDDSETRQVAFASMLVYTLATAAVLTKGDLPVYVVKESPQSLETNIESAQTD
ncbi:MAG: cadmium-containing carbonic anhydrase [bacterium]|nr:cadmium-containing carbonic anhydrase [bacterium]